MFNQISWKRQKCMIDVDIHLNAPAKARAVYSPKLRPHATSTKSMIPWPPSRARSTSTAARLSDVNSRLRKLRIRSRKYPLVTSFHDASTYQFISTVNRVAHWWQKNTIESSSEGTWLITVESSFSLGPLMQNSIRSYLHEICMLQWVSTRIEYLTKFIDRVQKNKMNPTLIYH